MSAQSVLQAALAACLGEALTCPVFDAPPVRGALPYAVVEEAMLADWGTKDLVGREGRVSVTLRDGGERPVRLRLLAGAVEDALGGMPRDIGEGWRVVTLLFVRARIVREGAGWAAVSEFQVRMLQQL